MAPMTEFRATFCITPSLPPRLFQAQYASAISRACCTLSGKTSPRVETKALARQDS
jgi:hypothetical protein